MDRGRIDHAPAVHDRNRIVLEARPESRIERAQHGFEEAALDHVVALAVGKIRDASLRRFRVREYARLVRALVDRGTADFGEPDRLALRNPSGGRRKFGAADALEMRIGPKAP